MQKASSSSQQWPSLDLAPVHIILCVQCACVVCTYKIMYALANYTIMYILEAKNNIGVVVI